MRIAIVGTGISGTHVPRMRWRPCHDVTVFEADDRPGGHTNTVRIDARRRDPSRRHRVHRLQRAERIRASRRLLAELGVDSSPSDMSFSVTDERSGVVWRGSSLDSVFAQRANALRPAFWRMLLDVARFNRRARAMLAGPGRARPAPSRSSWPTADWSHGLPRLVPRAARRGDLVGRSRDVHSLPGRVVRPVLRQPRAPPRSADQCSGARCPAALAATSTRSAATLAIASAVATPIEKIVRHDRPRGAARRERAAETSSTTSSSRPTATRRSPARRPDAGRARGPRCRPLPAEHGRRCTPTCGCSRRYGAPGRAGTTTGRPTPASRTVTYHMNRLQSLASASRDLRHAQPPPTRSSRTRSSRRIRLRPSRLRPAAMGRSAATPRSAAATGPRTAARTGATASTRTACTSARRVCAALRSALVNERDLRGHGLPSPVASRSRTSSRTAVALAVPRSRRGRPSVSRSILSGRPSGRMPCGSAAATSYGPPRAAPVRIDPRPSCEARTGVRPAGPVRMLAHLRTWGWLFNPIACYWCCDASGTHVEAFVADVTSTPWHERHAYVVTRDRRASTGSTRRCTCRRSSQWTSGIGSRATEPADRITVRIESHRDGQLLFDAGIAGTMPPDHALRRSGGCCGAIRC